VVDLPSDRDTTAEHRAAVLRSIMLMRQEISRPLSVADMARPAAFSPFHFHRLFRAVTTVTPGRFLAALRMAEARRLLLHSALTATAISAEVGYASSGTFTTQFTRLVGMSPERFRRLVRGLADLPVAALAPGVEGLLLVGAQPGTRRSRHDEAADWRPVAVGRSALGDLRAAAAHPAVLLERHATVTDALVDGHANCYRLGSALMWPEQSTHVAVPVDLAAPRLIDPPLLNAAPLRRLAALVACGGGRGDAAPRAMGTAG